MVDRTQQIRARVEAATPGPWSVHHIERGPLMIGIDSDPDGTGPVDLAIAEMLSDATQDDAAFLAHAREDIPWLLEQLRLAHEALERARPFVIALGARWQQDGQSIDGAEEALTLIDAALAGTVPLAQPQEEA